ncbi:hypothetical protein OAM96_02285 [Candidatus Poseidoniaceae archaeon]|nr:hypothetical protein [Candidatus Poseidoniaceae archaeon]|tara:strand:- start:788 stop:1480 length:693 start_codon:yes stop_codon:yes gene_type:complete
MEENGDDATSYWKEIEHRALPSLIECANTNYRLNLKSDDLKLEFSIKYVWSRSFGNGKIRFGVPYERALEYSMFNGDPDLEIPPHLSRNRQFQAWWVAAHELAHEIVDMIQRKTSSISQPIIPNALIKFDLDFIRDHGTDVLVDLLENQAWWKESQMKDQYHLSYDDKTFKHGVFYQHIYRTLRRDVVNPKFGIEVDDWKQKSKPKIRYVKSGWNGNKRRSIRITGPILI